MGSKKGGAKPKSAEHQLVDKVLERRKSALERRAKVFALDKTAAQPREALFSPGAPLELMLVKAASKGFLLGLGDSWFDYFAMDVLDSLQYDVGYLRKSVARAGTSLREISKVPAQLENLSEEIEQTVGGTAPKAILLSGGGNDVVDNGNLEKLLHDFEPGKPALKEDAVTQLVDKDMESALTIILKDVTALCQKWHGRNVPILIHGYDHPIPDGRFLVLPHRGPWLEPAFLKKGYDKFDVGPRRDVMKALIDRLNVMQLRVAAQGGFEHVKHVDLRGTLTAVDYTTMWDNELHPTRKGFQEVAKKFAVELQKL